MGLQRDCDDDDHDHGLPHDLGVLIERRRALAWLGATGVAALVGACGDPIFGRAEAEVVGTAADGSQCVVHPRETAGPYPADGSNRAHGTLANVLDQSGIVRADMRPSLGAGQPVATGTPLDLTLKLVDVGRGCAPIGGHAIYLWHCDQLGRYSMYSSGVTAENYLRGVQPTASDGTATFVTIFPGCYAGRMPHMHFEVYRNTSTALSYTNKLKTSQLAFPDAVCDAVYASSGYSTSAANYARMSFANDGIFSDGVSLQMSAVTGSVANGYEATLTVGISV